MKSLLLSAAEPAVSDLLSDYFSRAGWRVDLAPADGARAHMEKSPVRDWGLYLSPLANPELEAEAELLRVFKPDALVVAWADLDQKALLEGALRAKVIDDFLPLPFSPSDLDGVRKLVRDE
jgi:DNA-binding response OmpR family regulator